MCQVSTYSSFFSWGGHGAQWFQTAKTRQKYSLEFTNFSIQVLEDWLDFCFRSLHALHIENLSNCCRHKYDQSISRIFEFYFWRDFAIWPNCVAVQWLMPRPLFVRNVFVYILCVNFFHFLRQLAAIIVSWYTKSFSSRACSSCISALPSGSSS